MLKIIYSIFVIVISLAFVCLTYILKKKFEDRQIVIQNTKQYPPEGLNPAQVAVLYNDIVTNEQMNSLILYLANKGYLKIEETSLRNFDKNLKDYRITKIKEYDGNNEKERLFLKEMLQYGFNKVSITSSELFGNIGITTGEIKKNLHDEYKSEIFKPFSSGMTKWILIMIVIIVLIIFIIPAIVSTKIMSIFSGIIGFGSIAALAYFSKDLKIRTEYGDEILKEIESFKKFVETAEKEELINISNENPAYFCEMLPYTFVIGSSDKWFEKFSDIKIEKPDWYISQNEFKMQDLRELINLLKKLN